MFESTPLGSGVDQIDAMRMGVEYSFQIKCRGFSMQARPLSMGEQVSVSARVSERISQLSEHQKNRLTEHTLYAMESLVKASTSEYGKEDPKITEYILERATPDEIQYLWKQYVAGCERVNPMLELMTPASLDELVSTLKKSPSEELVSQLTALSFLELVSVCRLLIRD